MLAEWAAFEREYGPLLIHDRIDWGFAHIATVLAGGGKVADHLPPWHKRERQSDESMVEGLRSLAAASRANRERREKRERKKREKKKGA